ncbi:zf-RING_2 domain-containing protein [Cephalotus follicularis]|uniref:E3 ubiquitin-protein ligase listerin n=1 Tax=Cephalotus follicularis TaxID=3775 RepID=A0A1Q3ASV1_CEPFO|nr:zf-RING_2 domain-containing protein [Cephalotus follicularis]
MGRQKGEGARTKARPSSSGLAASLLPSASAAASVGFGGYVGSSRFDSSLFTEDATSSLDIDSEVAQHLKRLARKDYTTKLKALASLSSLLKQRSTKDIVLIIPQWAFEYRRLLLDYNREVRQATHETMTNLVVAVGRDIAPRLKYLMGPWWFSQFDPNPEVSQAAKQSFQAAFPAQEKRLNAIILCTSEIFMYLEENLRLTPQILSDKAVALDELGEMHQQVISSSLLALAALLDVFVGMQLERPGFENVAGEPKRASKARMTAITFAENIFSAHKYFLDFLKSQSPAIRSATYTVLKSYIKNISHVFNEENMKTLGTAILGAFHEKDPACHSSMWDAILLFSNRFPDSWTSLNVQKTVLNRLWHFLRNGCFGSQQASYPALVLFLDVVPPKAIAGEKSFLDFFNNLWAGKNPSHFASADQSAFFRAFKECFLWGLHNAPRFCTGVDSIFDFRVTLIDNILVKLLWQEFVSFVNSKDQDREFSGMYMDPSEDKSLPSHKNIVDTLDTRQPLSYIQELGNCIIDILSGAQLLDHNLLSSFCKAFQDTCLGVVQQTENKERPTKNVEQIIKFLLLLERQAMQKGEAWLLVYVVGPALAKCFPLIRSLGSMDGVRLLSVSISIFGPRKVIHELFMNNEEWSCSPDLDNNNRDFEPEHFMQVFNKIFIPLCLSEHNCSTSARLDLLLVLLDDEYFSEQWSAVILYLTNVEDSVAATGAIDSDHLVILAMLLERARTELTERKVGKNSRHRQGSHTDHWHHEHLESTAVSIACSVPPFRNSHAQFMRAIIGGSKEGNQTSFVSRNALILIFKEIFVKLLSFIQDSSFSWVKDAGLLFTHRAKNFGLEISSDVNMIEMAQFALEVLDGSFFCLNTLSEESDLVSGILAAVFIIGWECSIVVVVDDALDNESNTKIKTPLKFCEFVHAFRSKISNQFWKSLSLYSRKKMSNILVHSIRSAIFKEDKLNSKKITSLCCKWMLEVLECLCQDQYEEQSQLDQLLSKGDTWPLWINSDYGTLKRSAALNIENNASGNRKFVSLIDKLIINLGIDRVVAGYVEQGPSSTPKETTDSTVTHRAWLAAELLCTWKWPGGSAVASFLPLLSAYAKSKSYYSHEILLDSIFNILLDGTIVHGENGVQSLFNVWSVSEGEVDGIEESFLRALLSLLITLFEDNIWDTGKAMNLFELIVKRLFIGEEINRNCLRILPMITSVLVRKLCRKNITSDKNSRDCPLDSFQENQLHDAIRIWLQKILSFPPLVAWQSGEADMEEWFQLVISCYPMTTVGGAAMKMERNIGLDERTLLLNLFRRQRHASTSATANQLPVVQVLLSKLMVLSIAYCWKDFDEQDWEFLFSRLRCWIQSAVVVMEEVAESVNDAITDGSPENLDVVLKKLEQIVLIPNPSTIRIAENALLSFSWFCGLLGHLQAEDADDISPLRTGRWDHIKDRILEAILRLFFCTGIAEAIASSYSDAAAHTIASSRFRHSFFWELVASSVVNSSPNARDRAVKSVEFWGLSKGPISSLYTILFSSKPFPSLQFSAYVILSTRPVSHLAIISENTSCSLEGDSSGDQGLSHLDMSSEDNIRTRDEISCMIEKLPYEILETELIAEQRLNIFLAWSLLLSHICSLPSQSPLRERLVQYIQDSSNSVILDCLFQHIPLELCTAQIVKKKDGEIPDVVSGATTAATHAITNGLLLSSIESLWPIEPTKMASLAGAIYGLMLRVFPAYVRVWFSDLRDRSMSSMIESFTRSWCSPPLIANELLQIKKANFADENFSVTVSKSANEVVATYTKDDTGMDLVIRLPASYPLRPVDVECLRSLGISEVKQRKWLMSMMLFVRNQNGALAEAIRIWKRNFDKEFEGVEECPICYSVIHTANHSLPRLACKTCKHKFHSACLYKWFSTSHKSLCPLCKSPF